VDDKAVIQEVGRDGASRWGDDLARIIHEPIAPVWLAEGSGRIAPSASYMRRKYPGMMIPRVEVGGVRGGVQPWLGRSQAHLCSDSPLLILL
jgi:hypothetical protein